MKIAKGLALLAAAGFAGGTVGCQPSAPSHAPRRPIYQHQMPQNQMPGQQMPQQRQQIQPSPSFQPSQPAE